jgi:hypothetical protein
MLATPDFCLVRRRVGPDHVPLLAEAILQIVRRGERVLFLSAAQTAAEAVLEKLLGKPEILPLLYSERDPSEPLRGITPDLQAEALRQQALRQARDSRDRAARRVERRSAIESIYEEITRELGRRTELERQIEETRRRAASVAAEVEAESHGLPGSGRTLPSGPFSLQLVELIKQRNHAAEAVAAEELALKAQVAQQLLELESAHQSLATLSPLAEAQAKGQWWSLAFWRARGMADLANTHASLTAKIAKLSADRAEAEAKLAGLAARVAAANDELDRSKAELAAAEIGRRRREWTQRLTELESARSEWDATWQRRVMTLEKEEHRPGEQTAAAVAEARERWLAAWIEDEKDDGFAHRWAAFLEEAADQMSARLPRLANVVAGTLAAAKDDVRLRNTLAGESFDWLIVDEAEKFEEAELLPLVRRSPRLILVGQPSAQDTALSCPSGLVPFHKLWHHLHGDGGSQYAWTYEADRTCCTLRPLSLQERAHLECESLADFPEIELRVLVLPKTRPCLAQVVFPGSMGLPAAKQFIYRELQEVAVERPDPRTRWEERDDAVVLHLGLFHACSGIAVELDRGVREILCSEADRSPTCRIDFAKAEGWTLSLAADWVQRFLNLRDSGRTCDLL